MTNDIIITDGAIRKQAVACVRNAVNSRNSTNAIESALTVVRIWSGFVFPTYDLTNRTPDDKVSAIPPELILDAIEASTRLLMHNWNFVNEYATQREDTEALHRFVDEINKVISTSPLGSYTPPDELGKFITRTLNFPSIGPVSSRNASMYARVHELFRHYPSNETRFKDYPEWKIFQRLRDLYMSSSKPMVEFSGINLLMLGHDTLIDLIDSYNNNNVNTKDVVKQCIDDLASEFCREFRPNRQGLEDTTETLYPVSLEKAIGALDVLSSLHVTGKVTSANMAVITDFLTEVRCKAVNPNATGGFPRRVDRGYEFTEKMFSLAAAAADKLPVGNQAAKTFNRLRDIFSKAVQMGIHEYVSLSTFELLAHDALVALSGELRKIEQEAYRAKLLSMTEITRTRLAHLLDGDWIMSPAVINDFDQRIGYLTLGAMTDLLKARLEIMENDLVSEAMAERIAEICASFYRDHKFIVSYPVSATDKPKCNLLESLSQEAYNLAQTPGLADVSLLPEMVQEFKNVIDALLAHHATPASESTMEHFYHDFIVALKAEISAFNVQNEEDEISNDAVYCQVREIRSLALSVMINVDETDVLGTDLEVEFVKMAAELSNQSQKLVEKWREVLMEKRGEQSAAATSSDVRMSSIHPVCLK